MELVSTYARTTAFGQLVLIPDPSSVTPPLALNPFHLLHPGGGSGAWKHVRFGPVTCTAVDVPQTFRLAAWGWGAGGWVLLHDNVPIVCQKIGAVDRQDSLTLAIPDVPGAGAFTALCVLPRAMAALSDVYTIAIAGVDARAWPCGGVTYPDTAAGKAAAQSAGLYLRR